MTGDTLACLKIEAVRYRMTVGQTNREREGQEKKWKRTRIGMQVELS